MEPKENSISAGIVALWGLLLLFQLLAFALAQTNALAGCPQRCGDVEIPYPFGIGPSCSKEGFTLNCTFSNGTYKPFLGDVEVLDISLSSGQARIADRVLSECYNAAKAGNVMYSESWTIDWAIRNKTCWEARRNKTSYACVSDNSACFDSRDGPGYLCNCLEGYQGNPYLPHGCQDIDECTNKDKSACSGNCINKPGGFMCECPLGGSKIICPKEDFKPARTQKGPQNISLPVKLAMGLGISASFVTLTLIALCAYIICERKGLTDVKEKYFQQHRLLWLLLDEIGKKQGLAFTIFTKEELEKATNNFATSNILGYGGNGTVYKGVVKHDCVVAIKRAKIIGEKQMEEYGKEMIILAQINHKNVVKLLGCCLEVEVPMLVYEFVPNGNLFQLFHGKKPRDRVTFETRLGIAVECAEALAYLHSSASPPIIHGDVKSSNILLDDRLMAKVADFGASRPAPINEVQCVTLVQGTLGYLDPEYMETYELTHKSDVYSFGVVLLELLTGKKALSLEGPEEERSLSLNFLAATTENRLYQLLDDQIKDEEIELIKEVAALARTCLHIKREERPSMKEVAVELGRLKKLKQNQSEHHKPREIEGLLDASSSFDCDHDQGDSTSCYSLEQELVMSIESRW